MMLKKLIFIPILFLLTGCISVSNLNPFLDEKENRQIEITTPSNAPLWLQEKSLEDHISSIGLSKDIKNKREDFYKQEAYLVASNNLLKKIYLKVGKLFTKYSEASNNTHVFDKDIKRFSEHISLKAVTYAKVKNSWIDKNEYNYYIQIGVDTKKVAELIQQTSKLLFEVDKNLYQNFLSNRAQIELIKYLEN